MELAIAALLTEVGVDPAATPEPVPQLRQGLRELGHDVDANALASLQTFSEELAGISDLAFNQEIVVTDGQARDWGQRGQDALQFVEDLLARVRRGIGERRP